MTTGKYYEKTSHSINQKWPTGCYGLRAFQTKPYLIFLPDLQTYLIYLRIWPTYLTNYYNLQNPDISDIGTNHIAFKI